MFELVGDYGPEVAAAWSYFVHLAMVLVPLFIGGSFLVGLLREYLPPDRIRRVLHRYDGGSGNVVAAGAGAITPFCSASTVPMLAGLLGAGAPLGIAFSFLLASPLVNELAIVLLISLFGIQATAIYVTVTFTAAIVGGLAVGRFDMEQHVTDANLLGPDAEAVATDGGRPPSCGAPRTEQPESPGNSISSCGTSGTNEGGKGCGQTPVQSGSHRERFTRAAKGAKGFFLGMIPYLLLGMTLGALVHGFVPPSVLLSVLGPENPIAVPLAAVAGAPIYLSMSSMLPIASTFADQGVPLGTVLTFVVGSAGVSLPNLILLRRLFDWTLLAIYAMTVVATGIVLGLVLNSVPV